MEGVVQGAGGLSERYDDRRGAFLEEGVAREFGAAFPAAWIYRGSMWRDPATGVQYENDLLVQLDTHLIIVEAKAGRVTAPARRGAEKRLEHTVAELVVKPSEQARRFADYLHARPGRHTFATKSGRPNKVDTTELPEILAVSVTLELLGTLASRWPAVRDAGFLAAGVELAPTMSLADLQIAFELLDSTCEKMHYLSRRASFEAHAEYIGDELDLLAFYLATGFNIGEAEFNGSFLPLYGMSRTLDPYFMRRWQGEDVAKPRRRLTSWWRDMLDRIETRRPPRWIELGQVLLNVTDHDQEEFERGFAQVCENARQHWSDRGYPN